MILRLATAFVLGGLAGWVIEQTVLKKPGPGRALPDFPFLPIYGVGAALVVGVGPKLESLPLPMRGAIYAAGLSTLEWSACRANQDWLKNKSWDYEGACVDVPHAITWGALGLLAEAINRKT